MWQAGAWQGGAWISGAWQGDATEPPVVLPPLLGRSPRPQKPDRAHENDEALLLALGLL